MAQESVKPDNTNDFERFLVVYNPASTNAKTSHKYIDELQRIFPAAEIETIETTDDEKNTARKILEKLVKSSDKKTLLCIAGGDGTVNFVLNVLLASKDLPSEARQTPILPLWGGNANDLAYMMNGTPKAKSLQKIIEAGKITKIYPLNFKITKNNEIANKIASCYASFGASGFATEQLNNPHHRGKIIKARPLARILMEFGIIAKAFAKTPTFSIKEDGKIKTVYEYVIINGSRIAKIYRLPLKLTDKAFYSADFGRKSPAIILYGFKAFRDFSYGEVSEKKRSFTIKDDVWAQFDGEVTRLEKNTKIEVSLNELPFFAISTKL